MKLGRVSWPLDLLSLVALIGIVLWSVVKLSFQFVDGRDLSVMYLEYSFFIAYV